MNPKIEVVTDEYEWVLCTAYFSALRNNYFQKT